VLLFLFVVIVISFSKKNNIIFACCGTVHYGSNTVQKRFFLVELGISLFFPKGKRRSKQD
jgi:hypothetical protein